MSDYRTSTRKYDFAIHGQSEVLPYWRRRQQQRRQRETRQRWGVYQPQPGQQPEFSRIIHPENLLLAFDKLRSEGGAAPGGDGLTYDNFGRAEIAAALRIVSKSLMVFSYRPYPARLVLIPKSNKRFRELRLATIIDRVVAKALQEALTPLLEPLFLPGVYGFRPGRSVWDMLLAIEKTAMEQNRWVLAVDDVKDAFPSVCIADALTDYRQHVSSNEVLWLIEAVLRGSNGQAHTMGIDQGTAVGPGTLNLRLHHVLDLPQSVDSLASLDLAGLDPDSLDLDSSDQDRLSDTTDAAGPDNPPCYRWADNLTYLCQSVYEGDLTLQQARALLHPAGFTLKGEDGPPTNLKRHGARVQILGFHIGHRGGRLRYGLGEKAWTGLEQRLDAAHEADNPGKAAIAAVRGWLAAYGPALEDADECEVLETIRRMAARNGYRELGREVEPVGWLREARQRWLAARRSALGCLGLY